MINAKQMLDMLVASSAASRQMPPDQRGAGGILGQVLSQLGGRAGGAGAAGGPGGFLGGGAGGQGVGGQGVGGQVTGGQGTGGGVGGLPGGLAGALGAGGLGGLVGSLLGRGDGFGRGEGLRDSVFGRDPKDEARGAAPAAGAASPSFLDGLSGIFNQATQGVRQGADDLGRATGLGAPVRDAYNQASGGQSPAELLERARAAVGQNGLAGLGALGGIGGLLLGTKTGRGLAINAAKLGGLALIGGLAYRAFQNYQAGQPLLDAGGGAARAPVAGALGSAAGGALPAPAGGSGPGGGASANPLKGGVAPDPAPAGSGFEEDAQDDDTALLYVRAMIAAAASDGHVDAGERARITGGLGQLGLEADATSFLDEEFANPASVEDLAASAGGSVEVATQIYTAARIAIEPDTPGEVDFLRRLAAALNLDDALVAHVDAQAEAAKA